jgi:hypothetical protein
MSSHPKAIGHIKRLLKVVTIATSVFIVFVVGTLLCALPRSSNCGGNSEALSDVYAYVSFCKQAAAESPEHQFRVTSATPTQREELLSYIDTAMTHRYLTSTLPYQEPSTGPRRVIMVCDTPFRNVPRRFLFQSPPRHAAAFSDGSTRLLSVAEFNALDRSNLKPFHEILATRTR